MIKTDAVTSIIEATWPRVIVGKMQILYGQYALDAKESKYLFNFKQGSYIHSSTKLLFRFGGAKPKDFTKAAPLVEADYYHNVRLPTLLSSLKMTIDRADTNVNTVGVKYSKLSVGYKQIGDTGHTPT